MVAAPPLEHDLKSHRQSFCLLLLVASTIALTIAPRMAFAELHVVVVEGLGGEDRYAEQFATQVEALEVAAGSLGAADTLRVFRANEVSREDVLAYFRDLATSVSSNDQMAVYLVGHGSYDDHEYKFNIQGPDLTGEDLAEMLDAIPAGNQLLVNMSSASGAIADLVASDRRTLILATRSGVERHATRFGTYFTAALNDPSADLDKNQVVTAAEAFAFAERQVDDYFERNGQLATEHPRLEGERADRFSVARLGAARPGNQDTVLRELLAQRDTLNADIDSLRLEQDSMTAEAYRAALLRSMVELAETEEAIEARERELGGDN